MRYLPDSDEFVMYQEFRGPVSQGRRGIGFAIAPASGINDVAVIDPASVSGLVMWLKDADTDYDAGTSAFDGVWQDSSGLGNDMVSFGGRSLNGAGADQFDQADTDPVYAVESISFQGGTRAIHAVHFSGGADELMKSDLLGADNDDAGAEGAFDNLTVFSVYRVEQSGQASEVRPHGLGSWRDTDGTHADHLNPANDGSWRKDNGAFNEADEALPTDEYFIRITRMTAGEDVDEWLMVLDGSGLDLLQTRGNAFTTSDDDFFLGDLRTDDDFQAGDGFAIAEVLVYSEALSDGDVAGVAEYLFNHHFPIVGDADRDGVVGMDDLEALAGNWQQSGKGWDDGDFNHDGSVDSLDLALLLGRWPSSPSSPSASEALASVNFVPEPTTGALLGALVLIAIARRHGDASR